MDTGWALCPSRKKAEFFDKLIKTLQQFIIDNVVIMGDVNAVMDRQFDKSNVGYAYSAIPQKFKNWLVDKGFFNIWRIGHPQVRDYTFFLQ